MTSKQTKRAIEIMSKYGQEGWRIESSHRITFPIYIEYTDPHWNWRDFLYRAVGPQKRIELKRGMEVKLTCNEIALIIHIDKTSSYPITIYYNYKMQAAIHETAIAWCRWPNGDGTWLPIEGEPEIISMEGIE